MRITPTESQSQEKLLGGPGPASERFMSLSHPGLQAPLPWTSARTMRAGLDLCTTTLHMTDYICWSKPQSSLRWKVLRAVLS